MLEIQPSLPAPPCVSQCDSCTMVCSEFVISGGFSSIRCSFPIRKMRESARILSHSGLVVFSSSASRFRDRICENFTRNPEPKFAHDSLCSEKLRDDPGGFRTPLMSGLTHKHWHFAMQCRHISLTHDFTQFRRDLSAVLVESSRVLYYARFH